MTDAQNTQFRTALEAAKSVLPAVDWRVGSVQGDVAVAFMLTAMDDLPTDLNDEATWQAVPKGLFFGKPYAALFLHRIGQQPYYQFKFLAGLRLLKLKESEICFVGDPAYTPQYAFANFKRVATHTDTINHPPFVPVARMLTPAGRVLSDALSFMWGDHHKEELENTPSDHETLHAPALVELERLAQVLPQFNWRVRESGITVQWVSEHFSTTDYDRAFMAIVFSFTVREEDFPWTLDKLRVMARIMVVEENQIGAADAVFVLTGEGKDSHEAWTDLLVNNRAVWRSFHDRADAVAAWRRASLDKYPTFESWLRETKAHITMTVPNIFAPGDDEDILTNAQIKALGPLWSSDVLQQLLAVRGAAEKLPEFEAFTALNKPYLAYSESAVMRACRRLQQEAAEIWPDVHWDTSPQRRDWIQAPLAGDARLGLGLMLQVEYLMDKQDEQHRGYEIKIGVMQSGVPVLKFAAQSPDGLARAWDQFKQENRGALLRGVRLDKAILDDSDPPVSLIVGVIITDRNATAYIPSVSSIPPHLKDNFDNYFGFLWHPLKGKQETTRPDADHYPILVIQGSMVYTGCKAMPDDYQLESQEADSRIRALEYLTPHGEPLAEGGDALTDRALAALPEESPQLALHAAIQRMDDRLSRLEAKVNFIVECCKDGDDEEGSDEDAEEDPEAEQTVEDRLETLEHLYITINNNLACIYEAIKNPATAEKPDFTPPDTSSADLDASLSSVVSSIGSLGAKTFSSMLGDLFTKGLVQPATAEATDQNFADVLNEVRSALPPEMAEMFDEAYKNLTSGDVPMESLPESIIQQMKRVQVDLGTAQTLADAVKNSLTGMQQSDLGAVKSLLGFLMPKEAKLVNDLIDNAAAGTNSEDLVKSLFSGIFSAAQNEASEGQQQPDPPPITVQGLISMLPPELTPLAGDLLKDVAVGDPDALATSRILKMMSGMLNKPAVAEQAKQAQDGRVSETLNMLRSYLPPEMAGIFDLVTQQADLDGRFPSAIAQEIDSLGLVAQAPATQENPETASPDGGVEWNSFGVAEWNKFGNMAVDLINTLQKNVVNPTGKNINLADELMGLFSNPESMAYLEQELKSEMTRLGIDFSNAPDGISSVSDVASLAKQTISMMMDRFKAERQAHPQASPEGDAPQVAAPEDPPAPPAEEPKKKVRRSRKR